jgi:hypothetical protein
LHQQLNQLTPSLQQQYQQQYRHREINIITLTANTMATPIAIMIILTTTTDSLLLLLRQMTIMMMNI